MQRASLLTLVSFAVAASAHALTIQHVEPRRMDAVDFTRFAQLLGFHGVYDPTRVALFTDPKNHTGVFFETELDTRISDLPTGSTAVLEVIYEDQQTPVTFHFDIPTNIKSHAKALYLGVTSDPFDTSKKKELPRLLAWRVTILDAKGTQLARSPSAVWEYPSKVEVKAATKK